MNEKTTVGASVAPTAEARFDWEDPLRLHDFLTEEECAGSDAARKFC